MAELSWSPRSGRIFVYGLALLAALAIGTDSPAGTSTLDEARPSFRCSDGLGAVQRMICGDSELRAYDRAMALAFARVRRSGSVGAAEQRGWLDRRNACPDRECVLAAYHDWFEDFDRWARLGRPLERRGPPPEDGSELMLETLQSPEGHVDSLGHSGALTIRSVGGGWYLFRATATYTYDPNDGRGTNVSTSDAHGMVRIVGGSGRYVEDASGEGCRLAFTRLPRSAWQLVEEGGCSGLGSSLTGIYRR